MNKNTNAIEIKDMENVILKIHPMSVITMTVENALPGEDSPHRETIVNAFKESFLRSFEKCGNFDLNDAVINSRYIDSVEVCDTSGTVLGVIRNGGM